MDTGGHQICLTVLPLCPGNLWWFSNNHFGCISSLVSSDTFDLHRCIVPVPRRPFVSTYPVRWQRWSTCQSTGVFHLEETMLSERLHSLWFPASGQWTYSDPCRLENPAPDRWDWQEEMLQFSGIWFPWHKLPAKGIICSSTQAFPGLHRLRQPCCTLFKIGLNFQRASFFFSSSETSSWNFDGLPHIEESALTHWIGYNWDPHLHPDPRVS